MDPHNHLVRSASSEANVNAVTATVPSFIFIEFRLLGYSPSRYEQLAMTHVLYSVYGHVLLLVADRKYYDLLTKSDSK